MDRRTLNTMTLGGLAIAIGEVVDDAVIGVENVARRLRENRRWREPKSESRVVLDAILEVRGAVVYATFAALLVFLPVVALSGVGGRLFRPLSIAYILAVLASLAVALTVTPALSMLLLAGSGRQRHSDPPVIRWSRRTYATALRRIEGFPKIVLGATIALAALAAAMLPLFGGTYLPDLREGHLILHVTLTPGTSLDESLRIGKLITKAILEVPSVRSVAQHVGRAEAGPDTEGTHYSEFEIDLEPGLSGHAQAVAETRMRAAMANFPSLIYSLKTFLTERVEETVSGFTAAVAVNVYGADLDRLESAARAVARKLGEVPGAIDVQERSPPGMPQINVTLRPADLQRWGLDAVEVLELVRTAYQGDVVGQGYEGNSAFDIIVILDERSRARVDQIGDLPLRTSSGTYILLKQVADVYETSGRYQVLHQNAQRVAAVTANVTGRDVVSFVRDARKKIASGSRPAPWRACGVRRRRGSPGSVAARSTRQRIARGNRHRPSAFDRRRPLAQPLVGSNQLAVRVRRRSLRCGADRRSAFARVAGRVRNPIRDHSAQLHPDDLALSSVWSMLKDAHGG